MCGREMRRMALADAGASSGRASDRAKRPITIPPGKLVPRSLPHGHVERPRLWEVLDGALSHVLTVVTGFSGAGKTVVLSEWAQQRDDMPLAWLSLDQADNDPAPFWTSVTAALRQLISGVGRTTIESHQRAAGSVGD